MKTLTLLRHAKSGWDEPVARDFDRPLNARGRRAAQLIGRAMRSAGLRFDSVIASPAVRVTETLDEARHGYGGDLAAAWDRRLYLASAATILDCVRELPDTADHALVSGHNPGLEDFVALMVADGEDALRAAVDEKFPTATFATLTLPIDRWRDAIPESATLTGFLRPRDLDPSLGPDGD